MMSILCAIVISTMILEAKSTLEDARDNPNHFTRNRKMPFHKLLKLLLSMKKTSSQAALNEFLREDDIFMTQQALSKARSKINHTPFLKLFNAIRDECYSEKYYNDLNRYKGKFLIAIDGSETALPNMPQLLEKYGGTGSKASSPTARMSIAYDITNDFVMDAAFTPLSIDERTLAEEHIENVGKLINLDDAIFIMDRGYPSEKFIRYLSGKTYYLMRVKNKFSAKIDALSIGSHTIVLYKNIKVRVVKFALPSGEIETLVTNLFYLDESEFKALYFKRWSIEVKYDVVKNKLELPNFGGFTENVILQDFWISMYLLNMAAIAKNEADKEIQAVRKDKNNKHEYQANVNTLIGSLRDNLAAVLFCKNPIKKYRLLNRIMLEIKRSVVRVSDPNDKVVRYMFPRRTKFHHNKKSNL